jgi:hypothetical protein
MQNTHANGIHVRTTVVHKLYEKDCEERKNFVNWYFHGVHDGEMIAALVLISDEAWFQPSGYMNL